MLTITIAQICDTVARDGHGGYLPDLAPPYDDVTGFVISSLESMPRAMGFGIRCATLVFLYAGVLTTGRTFASSSPEARASQWARWRTHRLQVFRDFVRFYESLILMALYSRPAKVRIPA